MGIALVYQPKLSVETADLSRTYARWIAFRIGVGLLLLAVLCGCATSRPEGVLTQPAMSAGEQFDFSDDLEKYRAEIAEIPEGLYKLGIGDILTITIYGQDGSRRTVPVDPSGHVTYMLAGTVQAAGRTIDDVQQELQERISTEFNYLIVNVVPVRFGSQTFTILGQVAYPGVYRISGKTTIIHALCQAKGFRSGYFRNSTIDLYDLRHATLTRKGKLVPVDFEALFQDGDLSQNVMLEPDDIINIPSALSKKIYVLGEVNFPRTLDYYGSISLLQALSEGRGPTPDAGERLIVIRGSLVKPEVIVVLLSELITGKAPNIELAPEDIVYVPKQAFGLLRDIIRSGINSFATTMASDSAQELYQRARPDAELETRPLVIE